MTEPLRRPKVGEKSNYDLKMALSGLVFSLRTHGMHDHADDIEEFLDCFAALEAESERLREFYEAHLAVERGTLDFELRNQAVERLERALAALKEAEDG